MIMEQQGFYTSSKSREDSDAVKVYLPVRHNVRSGRIIAKGLKLFLRDRGQGVTASKYLQSLKNVAGLSYVQSYSGI